VPSFPDSLHDALVARIRAGDTSAFETMFRTHFAVLFRFAQTFVGDDDSADDIVQDVLGWVWMHRATWAPPTDVLSYLLAAVRNKALDRLRTEKRRADVTQRFVAPGESPAMGTRGAATDVDADAIQHHVWHAIMELPEQRRTVLVLRWRHALDWDEIARVMGISVPAARMAHSRALAMLRERLPEALE